MLRPLWQKLFTFNWKFALLLIVLLTIPRFIIVLQANVTGDYNRIPYIFLFMILCPLIFLTKAGRRYIGVKKPANYYWLPYSFIAGVLFCILSIVVTELLFKQTTGNAFVYLSNSFAAAKIDLTPADRLIYFLIYALVAMTFSPIGEELFYRGIVHSSIAINHGDRKASIVDSLVFALAHLAHFGIVFINGSWKFLLFPSLIWLLFMFMVSRLFFICRKKTGTIIGAVLCHSGYNLAMMYYIFYHLN